MGKTGRRRSFGRRGEGIAARAGRAVARAGRWWSGAALVLVGVLVALSLLRPMAPPHEAPSPAVAMVRPDEPALGGAAPGQPAVRPPPPIPDSPVAVMPAPEMPRAATAAWLRFAAPAPSGRGPRIAIVIDDLGIDEPRTRRTIALAGPLTLSFLPYARDLRSQAEAARRQGHELLVHVPMEPLGHAEMGPHGLASGLAAAEVTRRLRWDLAQFDDYVGINNHMGSKFTSDRRAMEPVIEELKARRLLFLDSRTTAETVGARLADEAGVPNASRDVFLDDDPEAAAVAAQLAQVEAVARRQGHAIAIGHPHDATLAALAPWLAGLSRKGFLLVPVSAIVRERWAE